MQCKGSQVPYWNNWLRHVGTGFPDNRILKNRVTRFSFRAIYVHLGRTGYIFPHVGMFKMRMNMKKLVQHVLSLLSTHITLLVPKNVSTHTCLSPTVLWVAQVDVQ